MKTSNDAPREPQAAHSALQERSRETLARILTAAEELLETREFDELTMAELARHAGCAVGTLYGRVPSKESLLLCLHERYLAAGVAGSVDLFETLQEAGLEARVRGLVALMVGFFGEHRGLTRAVNNYLFARSSDDSSSNVAVFRANATAGFQQAAAFLAQRVDARVHPDPQVACEFGLLAATDVVQSRVAFGDRSGLRVHFSTGELKVRTSALLLAYLQHG